ncbi:MAG TPA: S9 family peptidase [Thermoanaerobaculia bacterium]|nr:S9 family peptidase [Thermoanaerobaculia bacterium]
MHALLALCLLLLASGPAAAAPSGKRPMAVDDQFRLAEPGAPLISPDGRWVLYTVERPSLAENTRHASTWLAAASGDPAPRELLRKGDGAPMWAPDSRSVFFLRAVGEGEERSRELFEQRLDGTAAVQRSRIGPGPDGSWQLARDGRSFLVVRPEASPSAPGADSDVVYVDEGSNGQTRDTWWNLWRYDLRAAKLTRVTQRDWSIVAADLAPDGRRAVVAARPDNGRNTRARTELFLVDLEAGGTRQLTRNGAPEIDLRVGGINPRWSPDGKSVLFSAVSLERWENGNGDLWLLDVASGAARNLTPDHTGRFAQPVFAPDGRSIFAGSGYGTARFPVRIDVASGRIARLVETQGTVRVGSWSADRRTYAYVYQDFQTPPDVYVGRTDDSADRQRRLTDLNPWVREEIALGTVERVEWPSFDGKPIEGLLHRPPPGDGAPGPLPLIVHVACGPGCAWLNSFSVKNHVWAGLGYAQLSPNVRGASNYDDRHMQGNRFDVGGGDRRDLLAGVDALVARGIADPDRLGIDGWSYGGILAGYTITQTDRFKAASLGAMISDWTSEFGASAYYDLELWFLGGDPWSNADRWRGRSPLTHADRVKTPTLLHHGDLDDTDSPAQSMNFFAALRRFGTPARLIRYPDEGHDLHQPRHLRIRDAEDVAWMERWVRGVRAPDRSAQP